MLGDRAEPDSLCGGATSIIPMSKRAQPSTSSSSGNTSPNGERKRLASAASNMPLTLGAPRFHNSLGRYTTAGGVVIDCTQKEM